MPYFIASVTPIKDDIPSVVKWPLIVGGIVFAVIIAKKMGKKVLK